MREDIIQSHKKYLTTMKRSRKHESLVVGWIDSCGDGVIEQRESGSGYHGLVAVQFFDDLRLDEQLPLPGIDASAHGIYFGLGLGGVFRKGIP